jgi:hypothetical protein
MNVGHILEVRILRPELGIEGTSRSEHDAVRPRQS